MKKLLLILLCLPMIGLGQCVSGDCENGTGTLLNLYGKYTGEFKNGFPEGVGVAEYSQDSKYIGEWENGERHGLGLFFSNTGGMWIGKFKNSMPQYSTGRELNSDEIEKIKSKEGDITMDEISRLYRK